MMTNSDCVLPSFEGIHLQLLPFFKTVQLSEQTSLQHGRPQCAVSLWAQPYCLGNRKEFGAALRRLLATSEHEASAEHAYAGRAPGSPAG